MSKGFVTYSCEHVGMSQSTTLSDVARMYEKRWLDHPDRKRLCEEASIALIKLFDATGAFGLKAILLPNPADDSCSLDFHLAWPQGEIDA